MVGYVAGESQPILRGLHDPAYLLGFAIFTGILSLIAWCMVRFSSRIAAILLSLRAFDFLLQIVSLIAGRIHAHTLGEAWIIDAALLLLSVGVMFLMLTVTMSTFAIQKLRRDKTELLSVFE